MKKLISMIFVLMICSYFVKAQDEETKGFRVGLKASPSLGWLKPDAKALEHESSRLLFGYGLITEFGLSKKVALATGLEVDYTGGTLNIVDSAGYTFIEDEDTSLFVLEERRFTMQYVTIPLTLKMKQPVGAMTYFLQFGANPSVNIKARARDTGKLVEKNVSKTIEDVNIIKDDASFFRIALNIGLGAEYNVAGTTNLLFGLNYNNGFTNVLKKESKNIQSIKSKGLTSIDLTQKATSNFVALTVGVIF